MGIDDAQPPPSVFAPLLKGERAVAAWRPIEHHPVVSSTGCLIEARMSDGSARVFKHLTPHRKTGGHWQAGIEPTHPLYWRREADFYASNTARSHGDRLRPARCYAQAEVDGGVSLELEYVQGRPGGLWKEHDYQQAVYALGSWQRALAAYPEEPWVCRDWLAGYLALREAHDARIRDPARWRAFDCFSDQDHLLVLHLLDRRQDLLGALARTSQFPAHNDFWPPNMFFVARRLVLLDWSFAGMGPVASDLCTLAFDAIYDGFIHPSDAVRFVNGLRDAYGEGLKVAGRALDYAIMAGLVVKYLWFFGHLAASPAADADVVTEPRVCAMRLVLSAGAWLRQKAGL